MTGIGGGGITTGVYKKEIRSNPGCQERKSTGVLHRIYQMIVALEDDKTQFCHPMCVFILRQNMIMVATY